MKIQVTEKHINKAIHLCKTLKNTHTLCCPLAIALREKTHKRVNVKYHYAYIGERAYPLTTEIKEFINKFDRVYSAQPDTFNLMPPLRLKYRRGS